MPAIFKRTKYAVIFVLRNNQKANRIEYTFNYNYSIDEFTQALIGETVNEHKPSISDNNVAALADECRKAFEIMQDLQQNSDSLVQ